MSMLVSFDNGQERSARFLENALFTVKPGAKIEYIEASGQELNHCRAILGQLSNSTIRKVIFTQPFADMIIMNWTFND